MTKLDLPPPEVWLYEDKLGGYYISDGKLSSVVKFSSDKEREKWLSEFPDVIRHKGKPSIEPWF